ncbi:hypothetical protein B0A48_14178 [Cryoendolithus antarcticus]|uniref:Uncharacterized protein n=1 Tax=Cryoendolithus antarcticus TaxID=1507870 RepID=A0A1V8SLL7_9PEZI|nr:hypothetical protein B0A48_14178 [Cryoendolithus antarcticus]
MPTQRPFLSNFLAAFRTHTQSIPKAPPSITASNTQAAATSQTLWQSAAQTSRAQSSLAVEHAVTSPRAINAKAQAYPAPTPQQDRQLLQHTVSPTTHLPRSPSSTGLPVYGPPNKPQPSYPTAQEAGRARRRGSDSSSDSGGFRDVRGVGGEKWFIGGRTAGGDERYYKLSMVKRDRSADRISADQLSL